MKCIGFVRIFLSCSSLEMFLICVGVMVTYSSVCACWCFVFGCGAGVYV